MVLHTDSRTALQALSRTYHKDNVALTTSILALAQTLKERGSVIHFNWIPSHIGLAGNEKADKAARDATNKDQVDRTIRPSLAHTRTTAKNKARDTNHQRHRNMVESSRSMRWYAASTGFLPIHTELSKRRVTEVAAHRLRLGYLTAAERIPGRGPLACKHCDEVPPHPMHHYLLHCSATVDLRTPPLSPRGEIDDQAARIVRRACEEPSALINVIQRALPPR